MALRKKLAAVATLRSDILILQEVGKTDASAHPESCWVGNNLTKGLAVVGSNGFRVRVHQAYDPRIEFIVPIEVTGPAAFLLLAVWVMHNRAVNRIEENPNRWQMLQALEAYESLVRSQRCVVAGDFNNAVRWDGPRKASNHSLAVEKLSNLGLVSAYHTRSVTSQGKEPDPTLFWMRHRDSPYHIDYIWLPQPWVSGIEAVEVGEFSTWVQSGLSDHVPLTVELDDAVIGRSEPRDRASTGEEVPAPSC